MDHVASTVRSLVHLYVDIIPGRGRITGIATSMSFPSPTVLYSTSMHP